VVTHETDQLFSLDWWMGLLFFRSEGSISGVLLPIALFLLISPALVALYDGCRSRVYGVALTASLLFVTALTWSVPSLAADGRGSHDALSMMFGAGVGGFPVVPMIASGALGFLVGVLWQAPREDPDGKTMLGIVLLFIGTSQLLTTAPLMLAPFVARTLVDISHLLLILMLAIVLTQWQPSQRGLRFIPILGRFSLLTFLAHRVVEQALAIGLRPLHLPGELVYGLCLGYDRALRSVYL